MNERKLYYFGCIGKPGHYLFAPGERACHRDWQIPGLNKALIGDQVSKRKAVVAWAAQNSDEIGMLRLEIEENKECVIE